MEYEYIKSLYQSRQSNINIDALLIAHQVSHYFDEESDDFELICDIVDSVYCRTYHLCIETICNALKYAIKSEDFDIHKDIEKEDLNYLGELACSFD